MEEIRVNLHDRIAEAEREGWLGEIGGLQVSLAGAEDALNTGQLPSSSGERRVLSWPPASPAESRSASATPCPASTTATPASSSRPSPAQPDKPAA
jgi:hypothetical protein